MCGRQNSPNSSNYSEFNSMPDVISLQEVTREAYDILRGELGKLIEFTTKIGIVMLFFKRLTAKWIRRIELPSNGGRFLLCARGSVGDEFEDFFVLSSHFESMKAKYLRREQLKVTDKELRNMPNGRWVLCGDFNFCSYRHHQTEED